MSRFIRVRAFAKINLGLRVLGRRADGYHEVRTVYQTIALADRLEVRLEPGRGVALECAAGPSGRRNLAYRAAERWKRATRFRGRVRIRLEKRIPAGAGLGGGSSDAAATLIALERLSGDRLPRARRLRIAAKLGSDVPFFLFGGRALAGGRGEQIWPLADLPPRRCLVVFPGFPVATAEAYCALDKRLTRRAIGSKITSFGARPRFPLDPWGPAENDFEEIVFARWPELAKLKRRLVRAGAETASLAGSGSALFAVFSSARQLAAAARWTPGKVFRTRTLSRAEYQRLMFRK